VQSVDISENSLGRLFGITSIAIGVAGGRGPHGIPALPREKASQVREALLSRFA
jgi:membrane protein YdbS with pleckstrin-like domain